MSLPEFWDNVRLGAGVLFPVVGVDSPRLDRAMLEQILRRANAWLTPKSVEGFDISDFGFLSDDDRAKLASAVNDFAAIASQMPPKGAATKGQEKKAREQFLKVVEALDFDHFDDVDAYRIGKQIEGQIRHCRPAGLAELRFRTGPDSAGDPAIWIWAILEDEAAGDEAFPRLATDVRELLEQVSRRVAPDRWPYVRFSTVSEEAVGAQAS